MGWKKLTQEEESVIVHKGTEAPFAGLYVDNRAEGVYRCKRCGASLFSSKAKFDSGTGWPSFDDALPDAVKQVPDPDGMRTEIACARCGAHLGHVFLGEGLTPKGVRHCVNSISLTFDSENHDRQFAYFAGGCFWGVEYYLEMAPGVLRVDSGYMGGSVDRPTYEQVSSGLTGHLETVEVVYDPSCTTYEALAKLFFEIHDPTQANGQGPDIGPQYLSVVFYSSEEQRQTATALVNQLTDRGYPVATRVLPATQFWRAEDYHQDYYRHKGKTPYCHTRVVRFPPTSSSGGGRGQ